MPQYGDVQRNRTTGERRIWTGSSWVPYNDELIRPDRVGAGQAALISAGETLQRWGSHVGLAQRPDEGLTRSLREDHPVATTAGALAPVLPTMALGGGPLIQAGIGAATGYLDNGLSGATTGAVLSGAGALAGRYAGRAINAARGIPAIVEQTDEATRLLTRGNELGFSAMPHRAKSVVANKLRLNQVAARSIGVNADELSPSVMKMANRRLKGLFDAVARSVRGNAALPMTADDVIAAGVDSRAVAGMDFSNMTGRNMMDLRTQLVKLVQARAAQRGGPAMETASDLIDKIDDAIGARLTPEEMFDWGVVREQYRNYLALNAGKTVVDQAGNVRPSGLMTQLQKRWGNSFKHNATKGLQSETADLFDATRVMLSSEFAPVTSAGAQAMLASGAGMAGLGAMQSYVSGGSMQDTMRNSLLYGMAGAAVPRINADLSAAKSMPLLEQILATGGRTYAAAVTDVHEGEP